MVRFPPKKSHDAFCPPLAAFQFVGAQGKSVSPHCLGHATEASSRPALSISLDDNTPLLHLRDTCDAQSMLSRLALRVSQ